MALVVFLLLIALLAVLVTLLVLDWLKKAKSKPEPLKQRKTYSGLDYSSRPATVAKPESKAKGSFDDLDYDA